MSEFFYLPSYAQKQNKINLPDYRKRYSVYAYDHTQYVLFYKKLKKLAQEKLDPKIYYSINPYDIIQLCAIRNKDGTKKHLKDEKHIYRIRILHLIYEEIAKEILQGQQLLDFDGYFFNRFKIKVYNTKPAQAELQGSELLSIKKRLKIHIELLRLLKMGIKIKTAIRKIERIKNDKSFD